MRHARTTHRRRWLGVPLIAWLVIAMAGVALAAWLVTRTTATSTFSAQGAGTLSIGDAATVPLFTFANISPGDTQTKCLQAEWQQVPTGGVLKMFAGPSTPADTGLQNHLLLTIHAGTMATNGTGIQAGCTGFTPGASPLYSGTLAAYKSSRLAFASGDPLTLRNAGAGFQYAAVRVTATLPDTPAVQAGAGGTSAALAFTLEGQSS